MNIDKAINLAIENVRKEGLTDIFRDPFEISLLKNEKFRHFLSDQVKSRLNSGSLSGLKVYPISHVLFPKKDAYDFRRAALIQPIDTIAYLALVLMYADIIEKHRIKKRRNVVFSYRFKPKSGYIFDSKYNFTYFQAHVSRRIKSPRTKVLVKCDISNFYDRLNLHRLESTLLSLPVEKKLIKLTNELLTFWANRDSYSLPIGGNASRILAEAALLSVDDYLRSLNVKFCRFVDDYRLFAPDAKTAHSWLTLLVDRLYLEGLMVNPAKTVIEDVSKTTKTSVFSEEARQVANELRQGRIIVGYTGTIPTKFRELSNREIEELKEVATEELEDKIKNNQILQPDDVRRFLRIVVASEDYSKLHLFNSLVEKFPQFTPLLVDLFIKKESVFPESLKNAIREYFSRMLSEGERYPEYLLISVVRLLGQDGFADKSALMAFCRNLRRNSGAYIGRAVLDALSKVANRTDVIEIRQYYQRADRWEKRAIIRIVDSVLSEEEKRPWLKNVKVHSGDDLFAIETFDPKKKGK
ncbi:RNA-directed DNA polymerase [Guyparkeria sp. 1SP6A2]|nr:RNA-directed DNA polymerase [Guyparkeria sp. 1SP6A2]